MPLTPAVIRGDKRCGKSGIPDNAKCTKRTAPKGPELKERAFALATGIQGARAVRSLAQGNRGRAIRQLLSAGKNASEYAQEKGERTGNKRLLAFATGKNLVESANAAKAATKAFRAGDFTSAAFNLSEAGNTSLEAFTFNRQRQGRTLANWEEQNRNFGDFLQAQKWVLGAQREARRRRINRITRRSQDPRVMGSFLRQFSLDSLTAGDFRSDKKCGASGIPDHYKCAKDLGRTITQQKKREAVPKDKEYKRLRALEKELDKNSPEMWGGERLSPKGRTYQWIKKNRPNLDPDKIGGNSPLAMFIAEKYVR